MELLPNLLNNGLIGAMLGSASAYWLTNKANNKSAKRKREFISESILQIKEDALVAIDSSIENNKTSKQPGLTYKRFISTGLVSNTDLQITAELATHEISLINSIILYSEQYEEQASLFKEAHISGTSRKYESIKANKEMFKSSVYIAIFCDSYLENKRFEYPFPRSSAEFELIEKELFDKFAEKYNKTII